MKKNMSSSENETKTTIELVFDGKEVKGVWYHPKLAPLLCRLCGKGCDGITKPYCMNVNPYCG